MIVFIKHNNIFVNVVPNATFLKVFTSIVVNVVINKIICINEHIFVDMVVNVYLYLRKRVVLLTLYSVNSLATRLPSGLSPVRFYGRKPTNQTPWVGSMALPN